MKINSLKLLITLISINYLNIGSPIKKNFKKMFIVKEKSINSVN